MQRAFTSIFSTLPVAILGCLIPLSVEAQVTPDGTTSTTVNQDGNDFIINQGDRRGDNLFHSFSEFSVPTNGSALFNNATDIANIFSRVTGSNISNIDGLIGANATANLFLINPNGIIFGPNASIGLRGSFFASTADSLLFEGDTEFSAVNPQAPPLLEVSIPIGASFRDNPGDIFVRGDNTTQNFTRLTVKNFNLIGGDITFDTAKISVLRGGRFELGGLSAAGVVGINENGSLSFPDGIDRADISLTNSDIFIDSQEDGSIDINARNLDLTEGSSFAAEIDRLAAPGAVGGDIIINATDNVSLDGSVIENILKSSAEGQGGDINITANSISLSNNSGLSSDINPEAQGDGGNIIINATESISLSGLTGDELPSGIFARVRPEATGRGGNVNITTPDLSLADGFQIVTDLQGEGDGGNITIEANDIIFDGSVIRSSVAFTGIGNAGSIQITTDSLSLANDAVLRTNINRDGQGNAGRIEINANSVIFNGGSEFLSGTGGQGNAGNIIINATDSISFDENGSGIFARVQPAATGNGGDVNITTKTLSLNGGNIVADTLGEGDGGNITLDATNIVLDGSGSVIRSAVSSTGMGDAGDIKITTDSLSLANDAALSNNTEGQGSAGRIEINANSVIFNGGSEILSGTELQGNAGNIIINANESISFSGIGSDRFGSGIFARVLPKATGRGGNVNITTTNLSLAERNQIVTDTRGNGNAGNVTIKASNILLDGTASEIRSAVQSTGIGDAGNINLITDSLSLDNGASLNTSTQQGRGDAGTVEIDATYVAVDGGSIIRSETTGQGNGGNVIINAKEEKRNKQKTFLQKQYPPWAGCLTIAVKLL